MRLLKYVERGILFFLWEFSLVAAGLVACAEFCRREALLRSSLYSLKRPSQEVLEYVLHTSVVEFILHSHSCRPPLAFFHARVSGLRARDVVWISAWFQLYTLSNLIIFTKSRRKIIQSSIQKVKQRVPTNFYFTVLSVHKNSSQIIVLYIIIVRVYNSS